MNKFNTFEAVTITSHSSYETQRNTLNKVLKRVDTEIGHVELVGGRLRPTPHPAKPNKVNACKHDCNSNNASKNLNVEVSL